VMPTPASKCRMRANTRRYASECADMKTSAKFEKGMRRARDYRSSRTRWPSEHSHNVGPVHALRTCLVRAMSLKTIERGVHNSANWDVETYAYIHITYLLPNASSQWVEAVWYCPRKSSHRRIGVTTNSFTKGQSRWYNWTVLTRQ
jgi:hypothetical protein